MREETLFFSEKEKEAIFSDAFRQEIDKSYNEVRSLAREKLKIRPEGGKKEVGR